MTQAQWETLLEVVSGREVEPTPVGFIIDSPWLPNWFGIDILDYFSKDDLWFEANMKAVNSFPEIIFLPGFWSEYGMCSEPSAFGARCSFPRNEFPHAYKCISSVDEISRIKRPDPTKDGLCPFILNRLRLNRQRIEDQGQKIKFSVSRGPLNIASYLMGSTEFLMAMMTNPSEVHLLLRLVTDFLKEWHRIQADEIQSIDGIMVLDDIIGFMGEEEFVEFGLPYFSEIYDTGASVKFLHNDAECRPSLKYLPGLGINLFNMGYDISLEELRRTTSRKVAMLGNIPPRDILAEGTPEQVAEAVNKMKGGLKERAGIIFSCGGGMPPGVSTENIEAFLAAAR